MKIMDYKNDAEKYNWIFLKDTIIDKIPTRMFYTKTNKDGIHCGYEDLIIVQDDKKPIILPLTNDLCLTVGKLLLGFVNTDFILGSPNLKV